MLYVSSFFIASGLAYFSCYFFSLMSLLIYRCRIQHSVMELRYMTGHDRMHALSNAPHPIIYSGGGGVDIERFTACSGPLSIYDFSEYVGQIACALHNCHKNKFLWSTSNVYYSRYNLQRIAFYIGVKAISYAVYWNSHSSEEIKRH